MFKSVSIIHLGLVGLCIVASLGTANAQKEKLGVYIESLCPDSRRFVLNQLIPTYRQINSILEPIIIPFGHARVLGNNKMVCQHGPSECEGNRMMACILTRSKNETDTLEAIGCMFEGNAPRDCVTKHLINGNFDDIENCSKSDESYQMMTKYEKLTGRVAYIPHLTLNDQYSYDIQKGLENDLKEFVCSNYNGTKPQACQLEQN